MKHLYLMMKYCMVMAGAMLLTTCTENPFGADAEITSKRNVTGTIRQADNGDPLSGVYVWLEGLNIATASDSSGAFQLTLPAPSQQPGGGFTGAINLYYFVGNFQLDSTRVILRNGEFLYSQGSLNERGRLLEDISLKQLVTIQTVTQTPRLCLEESDTLSFDVVLDVLVDEVTLLFERQQTALDTNDFSRIYFESFDPPGQLVRLFLATGSALEQRNYPRGLHRHTSTYIISDIGLLTGRYRLTPVIWVLQPGIPERLLSSLGAVPRDTSLDFLNIPYKRQPAFVDVICTTAGK